jgi:hypothetical protein
MKNLYETDSPWCVKLACESFKNKPYHKLHNNVCLSDCDMVFNAFPLRGLQGQYKEAINQYMWSIF